MRFTVFTPSYNRGFIIETLYQSLQRQTFKDFEWIVIDDGSSDNTEELFSKFQNEGNFFPIIYKKVENGGKHRAINKGLQIAQGELFFIVDSDDFLSDDALEQIDAVEKSIPANQKSQFAGICGLRKCNGKVFDMPEGYLDLTNLERKNKGMTGDMAEVFYRSVLQKYPFPEFEGEKFVIETLIWDRMARDGLKLRYFNRIIYLGNYLSTGLTAQGMSISEKSPRGWAEFIKQSVELGRLSGFSKWQKYMQFYYSTRGKFSFIEISKMLGVNTAYLYLRLLGMRVFFLIYDR